MLLRSSIFVSRIVVSSDATCVCFVLWSLSNNSRIVNEPGSKPAIEGTEAWSSAVLLASSQAALAGAGILATPPSGSIIVKSRVTSRRISLSSWNSPPSGEI